MEKKTIEKPKHLTNLHLEYMEKIENTAEQGGQVDVIVGCDLYLRGDLSQMGTQRQFLNSRGFNLEQVDVYPVVKKEDVIKALTAIWISKTAGWWHYSDLYFKHNICTPTEFKNGFSS